MREERLHTRFQAVAGAHPSRVAVRGTDGELTYGELEALALKVEGELRGLAEDRLVAARVGRTHHAVAVPLGIMMADRAYVPIDPAYPERRQDQILADAGVRLIVTDLPMDGESVLAEIGPLRIVERASAGALEVPPDTAYVIYTSGSTGAPKGCVVSHSNVLGLMDAADEVFSFDADDVWVLFHSLSFDFSVWEMWGALSHGARLLVPAAEVVVDPKAMISTLLSERVTVLNQVPSVFGYLVRELVRSGTRLPALRYVVFGGEAMCPPDLELWWSAELGGAQMVNMYGITETTVHVTHCLLSPESLARAPESATPIGRPLGHLAVSLRDSTGAEAGVGEPGEIWVSGGGVAHGYLGRADLTASRFVTGPAGSRHYRSGDWGTRDEEGNLYYIGRRDTQVKLRGFRIELGEIESVLSGMTGVRGVACVVEKTSIGEPQMVAYVDSASPGAVTEADVKGYARLSLPRHMVPHRVKLLDSFPLTGNGKLDRAGLAAHHAAQRTRHG
ncbi:amino acid adenylation domain-containing protein [Streptosporangium amethystogenes]|uniref:amino acid adenylation domain-containing protein n=1 Tax=Streptosporangium amethystogenes TaxID=2002 RepID=UPI00146FD085|nr:amino acid adenylation domain-containing protein [Streptosporangium amethystogenes]